MDNMETYTIEETATRLKVHRETVRRLCRSGQIHAVKVGSKWRIPRLALEAYLTRVTAKED